MTWLIQNWRLALLLLAAAVFGYMRIEARWLRNRLDKAQAREAAMKRELDAHERMNDADLGTGATDSERIDRLRRFADKHGEFD